MLSTSCQRVGNSTSCSRTPPADIPELFYRSFANLAPSERARAFAALAASKVPVEGILGYYAKKKEYETCFELWSILLDSRKEFLASGSGVDLSQTVKYVFDASKVLEKMGGSEAARAWALDLLPARVTNEAVVISYTDGGDGLTFDLSERPTPKPMVALLLRAYSATRMKLPADDPRYLRLLRDVENAPAHDFFATVSRYLLQRASPEDMVARLGRGQSSSATVTYALALRALSEGDYEAGNDWLVATMLLSKHGDFSIVWAHSTLNRWAHANKSFAQIAKEGIM